MLMPRHGYLAALVLTAACASSAGAPQPSPAGNPGAGAPAVAVRETAERPIPYPIFESKGFADAVTAGTRTRTGAPGAAYWQQRARYRLTADYEPNSGRLRGEASIVYHNRSPGSLPSVYLHLYDNLFAPDAMRNRSVPVTDGVTLARVAAGGTE